MLGPPVVVQDWRTNSTARSTRPVRASADLEADVEIASAMTVVDVIQPTFAIWPIVFQLQSAGDDRTPAIHNRSTACANLKTKAVRASTTPTPGAPYAL